MKTEGRRRSTNIEVETGGGRGGGMGGGPRLPLGRGGMPIGVLLILGLVAFAVPQCRGPILQILAGGGLPQIGGAGPQGAAPGEAAQMVEGACPTDQGPEFTRSCEFLSVVLGSTEDVWTKHFEAGHLPNYGAQVARDYPEPSLRLFKDQTSTGCGEATSAIGPFYCPPDDKLFIDLSFNQVLARQLNSPGDFAQAYVIAHEVGHHVSKHIGAIALVDQQRRGPRANEYQVRLELQADCFAGVWAHDEQRFGQLEPGDIEEAMTAAHNIGDDTLQRKGQGYIDPDSFTHGTSEQRMRWFRRGFDQGDPRVCDTFPLPYDQL